MLKTVTLELDENLGRYLSRCSVARPQRAARLGTELLAKGYHQVVRDLHRRYLNGELTLRQMAKEVGLEYRQLYGLLEEMRLPVA